MQESCWNFLLNLFVVHDTGPSIVSKDSAIHNIFVCHFLLTGLDAYPQVFDSPQGDDKADSKGDGKNQPRKSLDVFISYRRATGSLLARYGYIQLIRSRMRVRKMVLNVCDSIGRDLVLYKLQISTNTITYHRYISYNIHKSAATYRCQLNLLISLINWPVQQVC